MRKPNFRKTRNALARYDAFMRLVWDRATDDTMQVVISEEERFARAVGRAYGEDTKAFNSPETCEGVVRPSLWLRKMVGAL